MPSPAESRRMRYRRRLRSRLIVSFALLGFALTATFASTSLTAAPTVLRSVDLERVQVAYRERGAGRPVVFVHALLLDSRLWLDQMEALCVTRRCLAPDFSGHGFSSPNTASKVDSPRYADELLEFLAAKDVRDADALLAIVNGTPPDEGVMLELGAAIALGKPVFLYRDDFRRCSDSEDYPLNLMVFSGLPQHGWQRWLYGSLEELADPSKALVQWLQNDNP